MIVLQLLCDNCTVYIPLHITTLSYRNVNDLINTVILDIKLAIIRFE